MADNRPESEKRNERIRNLIFFKMYATNEEMGQAMPGLLVVAAIILFCVWMWG